MSLENRESVFCSYETEVSDMKNQTSEMLKSLVNFRDSKKFTDVVLCVGQEEFFCHKVILAASSKYFDAMFSMPLLEQQTSHVTLEHVSPWALRSLLNFAYTGRLELSLTTVQDVFSAANLLAYPHAVSACARFMEQFLDITNCLGVQALAETHGLHHLADTARKLAVGDFTRFE